jgi:GT2 family glycosyltransferase
MKEKITVIIPTYKRATLLINCLNALTLQCLPMEEFAVIVVSDGEDKQTALAISTSGLFAQLNLKYVKLPGKAGPAAARNYGWRLAQSPLIAFTDDDCIPDPQWLPALLKKYSGESFIAYIGKTMVPLGDIKTDFALNLSALEKASFITANCACTKEALHEVNGFDERFKMAWREDSDLEFKLITHKIAILPVPEAIVTHPLRAVPWGISIKEQKKGRYDALLYRKYPQLFKKNSYIPIWNYYSIMLLAFFLLGGIAIHSIYLILFSATGLLYLLGQVIYNRLKNRHKSLSHIVEMVSTSLVIPFISVYWRIYGAIKYRVFFY